MQPSKAKIGQSKILRIHILQAALEWDKDAKKYDFRQSLKYDVLIGKKLYPPKAICGIAFHLATGEQLHHSEFSGARFGPWHNLLKSHNFIVVPKFTPEPGSNSVDHDTSFFDEISTKELERLAKAEGEKCPKRKIVKVSVYRRSNYVRLLAIRRAQAQGVCPKCNKTPFLKLADNQPYFEVHHKTPLVNGGSDTIDNVEALCPNCHRQRHDELKLNEFDE